MPATMAGMLVPKNATVDRVERAARLDRHGQPIVNTIHVRIPVRLEPTHSMARGTNGDLVDIDATIYSDEVDLRARDRLVMDNGAQYTVFDVSEDMGVNGAEFMRTCRLVKVRTGLAAQA